MARHETKWDIMFLFPECYAIYGSLILVRRQEISFSIEKGVLVECQ